MRRRAESPTPRQPSLRRAPPGDAAPPSDDAAADARGDGDAEDVAQPATPRIATANPARPRSARKRRRPYGIAAVIARWYDASAGLVPPVRARISCRSQGLAPGRHRRSHVADDVVRVARLPVHAQPRRRRRRPLLHGRPRCAAGVRDRRDGHAGRDGRADRRPAADRAHGAPRRRPAGARLPGRRTSRPPRASSRAAAGSTGTRSRSRRGRCTRSRRPAAIASRSTS